MTIARGSLHEAAPSLPTISVAGRRPMNASAETLRALWVAIGVTVVTLATLFILVGITGISALKTEPLTAEVLAIDIILAFVLGGVVLWGLAPARSGTPRPDAEEAGEAASVPVSETEGGTGDLGGWTDLRIPSSPDPSPEVARPPMVPTGRGVPGVAASSILGTYEERRWTEDPGPSAPPWSEDPELMRASLSFSPGLHPELRADRFRPQGAPPPIPSLTPGIPLGQPRSHSTGSLSRSGGRATPGLPSPLDRVPAPPSSTSPSLAGRRSCVSCGTGLTGATTDPLCVGCGRPLCSSCYWRNASGTSAHRCPTCLTAVNQTSGESRSGGRSAPRGTFESSMTGPGR
ncbi:MAG: hypothetical protein L3K19_05390 [Thermoplasmata archaeon]|nr:hypothetical protein [Thermoplasmata archaeon]